MTFQEKALAMGRSRKTAPKPKGWLDLLPPVLFLVTVITMTAFAMWVHFHPSPQETAWPSTSSKGTASDPPPQNLIINGERWQIYSYDYVSNPAFGKRAGQTECGSRNIFYDVQRIQSKAYLREAIWHEIVHAGHCNEEKNKDAVANWREFTNDMPEHNSVYELGMFLPGFVHDNPEFMKWAEEWK